MAAAFSRLQLAAALLEYDNDASDPDRPYRSAHESAIFAHLRRHPARPPVTQRRSTDYLGVSMPSENGSVGGRESMLVEGDRRSRASVGLRNMFGNEDHLEEEEHVEEEEEPLEVDLTSWGLDAFIAKDPKGKGKAKAKTPTSPQPLSTVATHFPQTNESLVPVMRRPKTTRSMSVGNIDFLAPTDDIRRKSIGSPLDLAGMEVPQPFQRSPVSTESIPLVPSQPVGGTVPFPTARTPSPGLHNEAGAHRRTYSTASWDSKVMLNERARTTSNGTMDTSRLIDNDNPFSLRPPSRSSRFDPKAAAHARTMSNASLGSRMLLDNDGASVMTGLGERQMPTQNRYSTTMDLLRPKILVMPSPLQTAGRPAKNSPEPTNIDGFELSSDGTPLPPGARSSRRSSSYGLTPPPIASNSFTPNPRSNLSLSQLTFRNYLSAGNHGGSGYNDLDSEIPRAAEEGEQMFLEAPQEEEVASIPDIDEPTPLSRPAGKLYGKSLIDDLESRKLQMRSKQRVFRGDDRPSMMARTQSNTSTLIDPASLRTRPASQFLGPSGGLERRNSANAKPLLNFDDEGKSPVTPRGPPNRSVFGVDTLWESEMARLRKMEAEEAEERERQKAQELKPEKDKKKRKKKKGGDTLEVITPEVSPMQSVSAPEEPEEPPLSAGPPVLPAIPQAIRGPPPATADDDSGSEESDSDKPKKKVQPATNAWHSDSEDEADEGPRRTTGIGLRYPRKDSVSKVQRDGDDSEEDVPLSATVGRAVQRATRLAAESDSDEDKPLNALSNKAKLNIPPINFDSLSLSKGGGDEEDEDNQPLGIRASRLMPSPRSADEDDDERPLGLHPEHQRRTQYQMMAQHQQMMMQAQMHNSMFFNPSMMGSGFFGPPMAPPMVMPMVPQAPMPIPSPPPVQDAAKLNRVDRWRHNVAIEGE